MLYLLVNYVHVFIKAILSSLIFEKTDQRCIKFWYRFKGFNVGRFNVEVVTDDSVRRIIWQEKKETASDIWFEANAGFSSNGLTYR